MSYETVILDSNQWMYLDMELQVRDILDQNEQQLLEGDFKTVFLGTKYKDGIIHSGSILTNFDNYTVIYNLFTSRMIQTCEIWDYCQRNINILKSGFPEAKCRFFEFGYCPTLDFDSVYDESKKEVDVVFFGALAPRRQALIQELEQRGVTVWYVYSKTGEERAKILEKARIAISVYSGYDRECISASRLTPIICNRGFVVTETCTNKYQNDRWSQYTVTVDYDHLVETIIYYLQNPKLRKEMADEFYTKFKSETKPRVGELQ